MTLDRPTFPPTRFREGYDRAEVDVAVNLILENLWLPEPRLDPEAITELSFTPVRAERGYDMGTVDAWLDEAAAELQRRTTPGAVVADAEPAPEVAPATEYPSLREGAAPPAADEALVMPEAWYTPEDDAVPMPTASSAIVEVPASTPWLLIALAALIIFVGALAYSLR